MTRYPVFPKEITFGRRKVGQGHPTYIIAEIGANFDHDIEKAKSLVEAAKDAGADCAKFQSFLADRIVARKGFAQMQLKGVHGSWGRPVDEVFREAEFPREWHESISAHCNKIGIDFSISPYDIEAVDLSDRLNVPFIKIGSGEITWHEMLTYIASKRRPMILATGDSTLAEVDEALSVIQATGNSNLILLQCITNYPSKIESANINVLRTYQTAFNILTGYSDHSPGIVVALGSVALGGVVIEKHFTLNKHDTGPDHPHSMEPQDFKRMVSAIRELEAALGSTRKELVDEEGETVIVQRRGLYARRDISKGRRLEIGDIVELRPALGILPNYKMQILGKAVNCDISEGEPIHWSDI